MHSKSLASLALYTGVVLAPLQPALAQDGSASDMASGGTLSAPPAAPDEPPPVEVRERRQIVDLAVDADMPELDRLGRKAQRDRGLTIASEADMSLEEKVRLQRSGRDAQIKRGNRLGYVAASPADDAARVRYTRRPEVPSGFEAPLGGQPMMGSAGDTSIDELERRGNIAQGQRRRALASQSNPLQDNIARLERSGRNAQNVRGRRVGYTAAAQGRPSTGTTARRSAAAPRIATSGRMTRTATASRLAGKAMVATEVADFGSAAIGGHSTGFGEFGSDMTVGQAQTFAQGNDPVIAGYRATQRLGSNLRGAGVGISESIRDPSRIPGNISRSATGTVQAGVGLVTGTVQTTAKVVDDTARYMTDPRFAAKKNREAVKTVKNFGKSACKGFSTLFNLDKKKCH